MTIEQLKANAEKARQDVIDAENKLKQSEYTLRQEAAVKAEKEAKAKAHAIWITVLLAIKHALWHLKINMVVTPRPDMAEPAFVIEGANYFIELRTEWNYGKQTPHHVTFNHGGHGRGQKIKYPVKDGKVNAAKIAQLIAERIEREARHAEWQTKQNAGRVASQKLFDSIRNELGIKMYGVIASTNEPDKVAFKFEQYLTADGVRKAVKALRDAGFKIE